MLIHNGGVYLDSEQLIAMESFNWLEKVTQNKDIHCLEKTNSEPKLFMFHSGKGEDIGSYLHYLIAAQKGSKLLMEMFQEMTEGILKRITPNFGSKFN